MTTAIYRAVKHDGQLRLTAPIAYRQHIATLGDGEEVEVIIRKPAKRQGTQAMRYLRGVVIPDIAHASGITDPDDYEAVFQALAWKFLRKQDHPFGFPQRQSTSKDEMSEAEMSAFIDKVIAYAESPGGIPGCRVRRPEEIEDWGRVPDYDWKAA